MCARQSGDCVGEGEFPQFGGSLFHTTDTATSIKRWRTEIESSPDFTI